MTRALPLALLLAAAAARGSPLDVQLVPSAVQGHGQPAVIALANVAVKNLKLSLARTGCGAEGQASGAVAKLAAGESHRFDLSQPLGRCTYHGELSASLDGQLATLPLSFETVLTGPPEVKAVPGGFDRETHTLHVTFSLPADHGAVEAFDERGKTLGETLDQELGDLEPGEPLALEYPAADGATPARLRVTVSAADGTHAAVDLFPWETRIPHEEVVFASGSAEIDAGERPKLAASLAKIREVIAKVQGQIPVRLFVAGYTDTVGSAPANAELSARRAESLARFFRAGGVKVAVLTAGLGEEALAVATPDDTPEAKNRRAEYILAVDPPDIQGARVQPRWKVLGQ